MYIIILLLLIGLVSFITVYKNSETLIDTLGTISDTSTGASTILSSGTLLSTILSSGTSLSGTSGALEILYDTLFTTPDVVTPVTTGTTPVTTDTTGTTPVTTGTTPVTTYVSEVTPIETVVSSTTSVVTTDPVTGVKTTVTTITDPTTGVKKITTQTEDTAKGIVTVTDPDGNITTTKTTVDPVTGLSTVTVTVTEANPIDVLNSKRSNVYNSLKQRKPFLFPSACYKFNDNFDYTKLDANLYNIRNYHPSIGFMTQNLLHDNCNSPKGERFNGGSHDTKQRTHTYAPIELNVGTRKIVSRAFSN